MNGDTALIEAASIDGSTLFAPAVQCARQLLAHGAKVNVCNEEGRTALSFAAEAGNAAMVGLLRQHHADLSVTDRDGKTAADRAAEGGYAEIAELLR